MSVLRGVAVGAVLLLVLGGLFVWFALPPIIGGVAVGILRDNGVEAGDMRVEVGADPPLKLLGLGADRVRVRATDVAIEERLRADSIDVTLRDVSLREQRFEQIEGRIDGAVLTPDEGAAIEAESVQISGSPSEALMTMTMTESQVGALVRSTIARSFGAQVDDVRLDGPDRLSFELSGQTVSGRLRVDDAGSLTFTDDSGQLSLELFRSAGSEPVALRSVRVADERLEATGTVDLLAGR
jgi:hypothetical protein